MIKEIKNVDEIDDFTYSIFNKKNKQYSNTIYCYDIEVTSLFKICNKLVTFDFNKDKTFYRNCEKYALPYISTFSIEENVYYFRNFYLFEEILKKISSKNIKKIIYVHNLSYEFIFLLNILVKNNYTVSKYLLKRPYNLISFFIKQLNIEFRCSYALTNMSLENSSKMYNKKYLKAVGYLDYNISRSPLTKLTKREIEYITYDVLSMFEFLSYFRTEYESVERIPYTQTGCIRRYLVNNYLDYYYIKKVQQLVPDTFEFLLLMQTFMGGITHANKIHASKIIENVASWDFSSDYPFQMCCEKYPCEHFREINIEYEKYYDKNNYAFIYDFNVKNLKSNYYNTFLSASKCRKKSRGIRYDNGRVTKADYLECTLCDCDFEMFKKSYIFDEIRINHLYVAEKRYLDKKVILAILNLYKKKTKLKNVKEQKFIYDKNKQELNGMYGCACLNIMKQIYELDIYNEENMFPQKNFDLDFMNEKISESKKSFSTLFAYSTGVWVTAYARKSLWELILKTDNDVVYYDTDSLKLQNYKKYESLIDEKNIEILNKVNKVSKWYNIDISNFIPRDVNENEHLLGKLEFEEIYKKFKTLGAKKYCYVDQNNNFKITVSGVPKSSYKYMKNEIDDFCEKYVFGYECGKMVGNYIDNQEPFTFIDCDNNVYTCNDIKYCINMQYTTYTLSDSVNYENALKNAQYPINYC
ncbi:MAG: hypothetical protein NC200_02695 [Candidatus Gastranaerophilales bacterium]|nr:hypothetical protein [Candidatus Gastranaerophilales bacterium]